MENETSQQDAPKKPGLTPIIIVVAVVVVIIAVAVIVFLTSKKDQSITPSTTSQQISESTPTPTAMQETTSTYKDGVYEAEGMYTSPGGAESIDVKVTLNSGIVESAEVVSNATRPTSKQMQASFIGGFKEQVIGKNIDELNLTKVSASSLAPKGFNNAIAKIKAEAKG